MENCKVSIIVPIYNVEKYLEKCLKSILSQTFTDFECILVDDCSPDKCPGICDEYARKDNRIKVIHKKQNEGLPLARKTGFDAATGKYIQFVDGDDWIEDDMLEKMVYKGEEENLDMVLCDIYNHRYGNIIRDGVVDKSEKIKDIATTFGVCAVFSKLVKKEIIDKIVFPIASFSEDRFISLQTIYFSNRFGNMNVPFYHYVYNENSITAASANDKMLRDFYDNYILIVDFIKNSDMDIKYFEPELSKQMNKVKKMIYLDRNARKTRDISKLYPESKFCKYLLIAIVKRTYTLLVPELFQIIVRKIIKK